MGKGVLKGDSELLGKSHVWTELPSSVNSLLCAGICESWAQHAEVRTEPRKGTLDRAELE